MNKKILGVFLIFMTIIVFISCKSKTTIKDCKENKMNITTTTFPIYSITKELLRDVENVNLNMLMDTGIDLHNFSPSSKDLVAISNSDLFIYIGGESDKWIEEVIKTLKIDREKQLNLISCINFNLKEEELKEGMEDTEEESEEEHEAVEYDEHIWLSLKNAELMANIIKEKILGQQSDDINKNIIETNYNNFVNEIKTLDKEFEKCVKEAKTKGKETTLVFADRFPFRYLVEDYGIDYFAAFKGCSAESEASFKTIVFLAGKLKELNKKCLFVIDDSDKKIARTVIDTAGLSDIEILSLDSMQSKTMEDIKNNESYTNIMKNNLSIIKKYFE